MPEQSLVTRPVSLNVRRAAKALITVDDRVLLVKETHDDGSPFWTLPGGGVQPGESDTEALKREIAEEIQCRVEVAGRETDLWYAHSSSERLSRYVVYNCHLKSRPSPNPVEGLLDCRLVKADDLHPSTLVQVRSLCQSLASRQSRAQVA